MGAFGGPSQKPAPLPELPPPPAPRPDLQVLSRDREKQRQLRKRRGSRTILTSSPLAPAAGFEATLLGGS